MSLLPEINQASAEINKFVAQANIHQTIAPVNPAAFTDPADTALLASRDPVIREVSVGMTGDAYSNYTVSGTPPLSLPNSLGKPLKAWEVDLLPYQEGTGDPSPDNVRPIHGTDKVTITTAGKNLFQASADTLASSQNCAIDYLPTGVKVTSTGNYGRAGFTYNTTIGQQYTCSFTVTNSGETIYRIILDNSTNWIYAYGFVSGARTDYFYSVTFTANTNTFMLGIYPSVVGSYYEITNLQLEFGSTASPYTPYVAPSQTVLTLPQTVYTGTIGSEGGESRFKKIKLSDIEESAWDSASTPSTGVFRALLSPAAEGTDANVPTHTISDQLTAKGYGPISANDYACLAIDGTRSMLVITTNHTISSVFDFLDQWGDIEICYPLATPIQFPLTSPTIPTPTGTATTWATAEDGTVDSMKVTYVGKA